VKKKIFPYTIIVIGLIIAVFGFNLNNKTNAFIVGFGGIFIFIIGGVIKMKKKLNLYY